MKDCITCRRALPLTSYYRHPQMADGHLNKCKECVIAYQKERRNWNGDAIRQYDRNRDHLPHRVAARKQYALTERGKESWLAGRKAWAERHKEKRAAHVMVGNAVRDGKLIKQPCEVCGSPYVQAHHDDYAKPLDVRWLCVPCHNAHHSRERELARVSRRQKV